jgi:NAD(P)-dependent dehydrogenase (short-subunit alcohol dehydrogenase family)
MGFLDGKLAVVTGGNRGIGRAIGAALAAEGARLALCSRSREAAERAAGEIGRGAVGLACDVQDHGQVRDFFAEVAHRLGGVDVLVNNAGVGLFAPVAETSPADWRRVIGTNLDGVFYCCREVIPLMKRRGGGYIVNIASLAGKNAFPNGAAYNASKFGLVGFSEALFQELRYDGIRVSYVMPGSVATEFGRGATAKSAWALTGEDVAEVVLGLLRMPARALASRVELRPSQPPRKS